MHDSALIESYFPLYNHQPLRAMWDQVGCHVGFFHSAVRVLQAFLCAESLLELGKLPSGEPTLNWWPCGKRSGHGLTDPIAETGAYMISEHFAAYFSCALRARPGSRCWRENQRVHRKDEFRHAQFAYDLLEPRFDPMPMARRRCFERRLHFRHVGSDVGRRADFREERFQAILTLDQRCTGCVEPGFPNLPRRKCMSLTKREQYLLNLYRSSEIARRPADGQNRAQRFQSRRCWLERLGTAPPRRLMPRS